MADTTHLKVIKQGVKVWNRWRENNSLIVPDLSDADLSGMNLRDIDLNGANLRGANLKNVNLRGADITSMDMGTGYYQGADLTGADLSGADLTWMNMRYVTLTDANLTAATLGVVNLSISKLRNTNFTKAQLMETDFWSAQFDGAILSHSSIGWCKFIGNDLSKVKGLDTVEHKGPSSTGIDTLYRSGGRIPDIFLQGAGVPDNFITYIASLVVKPMEFYSCFINYSSQDQDVAKRLYADLQSKGIRCWFAPEHLKIGEKIRIGIDESIRHYDKLLLILSKESVRSDWVEQEVETALAKERQGKKAVLFPIRIDDTVTQIDSGWPALIKNTRNIGNFTAWKDHDSYMKAFDRLLRDLKK